ncbi:MAG: spore germination protein, partial [Candidatus Scatosoma sp.]
MNTFEPFKNERFEKDAQKNAEIIKRILPSEDVPVYGFSTKSGIPCALIYADGMVNKQLLGDLAARPLSALNDASLTLETVKKTVLFPEIKIALTPADAAREILDGNALLLCDGIDQGVIVGAKLVPVRAVTEPQTSIAVKGPREGFIEDVKTNMALIRKRLKTGNLRFEAMHVGKQSDTSVALCYLSGIADESVLNALKKRLGEINTDVIIDSSYVAAFIAPRRYTLFKETGTTEKPDIFCAKIAEGRIGILVDDSPVALTVPYLLAEDFQSADDYFVSPFAATVFRFMRFFAATIALLLPAFYVASQLFKIQLIPLNLTLTIAGSIRGLPLSPSLEMLVVLLIFEILS